jgi:hypothetical protein
MTQKPWSKLKKELEKLFVPGLNMEFNCNSYPIRGQWGHRNSVPRFYLLLDKEVLWDFPRDFEIKELHFGWWADSNKITDLLREYIDTPIDQLLIKKFENERLVIDTDYLQLGKGKKYEINYHLTELLIAADRRIGKEKLLSFSARKANHNIDKILEKRLKKTKGANTGLKQTGG